MGSPDIRLWNILLATTTLTTACAGSPIDVLNGTAPSGTSVALPAETKEPTKTPFVAPTQAPIPTPTRTPSPASEYYLEQCKLLGIEVNKPKGWTLTENPFKDLCIVSKDPVKKLEDMRTGLAIIRRQIPAEINPLEEARKIVTQVQPGRRAIGNSYSRKQEGSADIFGNYFLTSTPEGTSDQIMRAIVINGTRSVYVVWFIEPRAEQLQVYNRYGGPMMDSIRAGGYPLKAA